MNLAPLTQFLSIAVLGDLGPHDRLAAADEMQKINNRRGRQHRSGEGPK
jgi:hypothetical protein